MSAKKRHDNRTQFRIRKLVFAHSSYSTTDVDHGQLGGATQACRFQTKDLSVKTCAMNLGLAGKLLMGINIARDVLHRVIK